MEGIQVGSPVTSTLGRHPDSQRSWVVAIFGSVAMVFTFGTPLSYGVFRHSLSEAFNIQPFGLSMIFSGMLFTLFIGSGIIGMVALRLPARGVLLAAAGASALIAPSLYVVDSYVGLAIVFITLGLALGTTFVLIASVVPRWFEAHRGAATALIFTGNGLGLFLLPIAWQIAISRFGIRQGFFLILSMTAIAFFIAGLACSRPGWAETSGTSIDDVIRWLTGLIGTRQFQLLFVGIGLSFGWYQLLAAYAVDLFTVRMLSETSASTAFGLIGGVSIISRIGGGYLADRVGSRRTFLGSLACSSVGIVMLLAPQLPILFLGIILIGLGLGGCATIYIPLLMETYDPRNDTAIVGVFNVSAGVSALAMPPLGIATVTYMQGYSYAVLLTVCVAASSFWLIQLGTNP